MATITTQKLKQKFITTDLDRKLKADKQGALRDQIVGNLVEWTDKVERHKQSGLPPDDFFKSEKMLSTLRVAEQVVRRTWNSFHTQ